MSGTALSMRSARPSDAAAMAALTRAAYAAWLPETWEEQLPGLADFDATVREHHIELLFVGDTLAGLADLLPEAEALLVESLAVAPEHQGHGHAGRLMTRAEAVAGALGLASLRLYTDKTFTANLGLYRHLGFAVDGEETFRGGTIVSMSKGLGRPLGPAVAGEAPQAGVDGGS